MDVECKVKNPVDLRRRYLSIAVLVGFSLADSPVAEDFNASIDVFLLSRKIANRGKRTIKSYRDCLRAFVKFRKLRNENPRTISKGTILACLNTRLKQVTTQTVNRELRHKGVCPLALP